MKFYIMILMLLILNLRIIPQEMNLLGTWSKGALTGQSTIVKFSDNLMIFNAGRSLRLYNSSNIDEPYELDAVYVPPLEDIILFNAYIIVKLSYLNTIKVFRISDQNKLIYEQDIEFDKNILDINIINGKLFLLTQNEISIYSIENGFDIAIENTINCSNDQYSKIVGNNDYFIMSKQSEIAIYQINENNSYALVSNLNTGGGSIVDMKIKENILILSGYHIGLRIVNIAQLANPTITSNFYLEKTGQISFSDNAAFIHDYSYQGVKIFDISNPETPTFKSEYFVGNQYTGENYFYRDRLFICNYYVSKIYQVKIVNYFEPNYFQDIIAKNNAYIFYQVQIYNNTAIIRTNFGISFVNASNYDEMEIYSELKDIGTVSNILLFSNYLFVSAEDKILIYDIENPQDVKLITSFTHDEVISSFIIDSNFIYLYSNKYFSIYDISVLTNIQQKYQHYLVNSYFSTYFFRMVKLGNKIHLYVQWQIEWSDPNDPNIVLVIDISDPNNAVFIGQIENENYDYKLYEHNGIIYGSKIANYWEELSNELNVCVITNLDSVYSIYSTKLSDKIDNLYFSGNRAYVYRRNKIMTIDISSPTNPIQIFSENLDINMSGDIYSDDNTFYFPGTKNWRNSLVIYNNKITSVSNNSIIEIPDKLILTAYPNPFNPSTTIKYSIPSSTESEMANVKLIIFDILGRKITELVNKEQKSGNYEVKFDAKDISSGVYFYRLQCGGFSETKKLILLR